MKLLIITQKVNKDDPEFLFFYRWIEEFARLCSFVTVVCLEEGKHEFASNVKVLSLGKDVGQSRLKYILRFYKYVWKERYNYDDVFVHMNPEYIVLGGLLWKIWNKKIALWYTHRQVNFKLRVATWLSNTIFTASPEGFGLKTSKLRVMGHGIDTDSFSMPAVDFARPLVVGHVGRITKIKNIDTILKAMKKLPIESIDFTGAPVTEEDKKYKIYLDKLVNELGLDEKVHWNGISSNHQAYEQMSLSVNATPDGGMDKVVLESLAAGRPVFTSNKAFKKVFGEYANDFIFAYNDADSLAQKTRTFLAMPDKSGIIAELSKRVKDEYDVRALVQRIVDQYGKI